MKHNALEFTSFTLLTQNLHHFSNLWHIFCCFIQSFNTYKKKLMWTSFSIQLFFHQCMFGLCSCGNCWRISGSLDYAWSRFTTQCCPFGLILHVLMNRVVTDTASTFHITQYMSLADNTWNLTLPCSYASSLSNMVLLWIHKVYWYSSHFRIFVTFL